MVNTKADIQGAGFDTTNQCLQWFILCMSKYPEVQQSVCDEISNVIGYGTRVELKHRVQLVYTEATILEVLRISSINPFGLRKCTIKSTTLNGYDINEGTIVFFNLLSVSHDKEFRGDPQNFRPERFIDDDNKLITKKCNRILTFGLGRRRCLGEFLARMMIFVLFTSTIRKCELSKPPGELYDMQPVPGLTYSPKPFRVMIKERHRIDH